MNEETKIRRAGRRLLSWADCRGRLDNRDLQSLE